MSLIACGSIHQGHERFISVMNLEEGKIFLCVWLFYYVSNFCRFNSRMEPGAKISIKSFFIEIIFYSVHPAGVLYFYSRVNYRLQFAGLGRKERKV